MRHRASYIIGTVLAVVVSSATGTLGPGLWLGVAFPALPWVRVWHWLAEVAGERFVKHDHWTREAIRQDRVDYLMRHKGR